MSEIKSSILNSKSMRFVKKNIEALEPIDKETDFRVELIEYINDSSDAEDDQFFWEMLEFARFLNPEQYTDSVAFTTPDKLIYLNAPSGGPANIGKKFKHWDFIYDHECLHQLWDTFEVGEQIKKKGEVEFNHNVLNVASDCVINDYLSYYRNKERPKDLVTPELLEEKYGVKYDRKVDTQYTLYLKLMKTGKAEQIAKLDDFNGKIKSDKWRKMPPPPPLPSPDIKFPDDYVKGYKTGIQDVLDKKVDPLTYKFPKAYLDNLDAHFALLKAGKVDKFTYDEGYNDAIYMIKDGLENGVPYTDENNGGSGGNSNLPKIPWDQADMPKPKDQQQKDTKGVSGDNENEPQPQKPDIDKMDKDAAAGDAGKSAGEAKKDAAKAQDAADKAQKAADSAANQADSSGSSEDKDAADKAQEAADAAQKAADKAAEAADKAEKEAEAAQKAADKGDTKGAQDAAKKAREAAEDAKEAATEATGEGEGEGQSGSDKNIDKMSDNEAAGDAKESADAAQKAADKANDAAKDAADKAAKSGSKEDKELAEAAKDAAKNAQKAADNAKKAAADSAEAAKAGDSEGAKDAAKKARDERNKAQDAQSEAENKAGADITGKGNDSDKHSDKSGDGDDSQNNQPREEKPMWSYDPTNWSRMDTEDEDVKKIRERAAHVIEKYKAKISGDWGKFIQKCKKSMEMKKSGLAVKTYKGTTGWDKELHQVVNAYVKKKIFQKKRTFEKTYHRLRRGSGFIKYGEPIDPGKRVRNDKLTINAAFYIDRSGSMSGHIDDVFKACYIIAEAMKKQFGKDKVVDAVSFRIFAFDDNMQEIPYGKKAHSGGGTMPFHQILKFIKDKTSNFMINIIITDAGFEVNKSEIDRFLKELDGMFIFVPNTVSKEMIAVSKNHKTQLFYVQADPNFTLDKQKKKDDDD